MATDLLNQAAADRVGAETVPASETDNAAMVDRRRPGRPEVVSPALIELLRWQGDTPVDAGEPRDELSAAHGIMIGTVLGLLLWVAAYVMVDGIFS